MGKVILVWDLKEQKKKAVKIIKKGYEEFYEEQILRTLKKIRNIPKLYECREENGYRYIVMEYISGISMKEYIRIHGKQREKKVVKWGIALCNILQCFHEAKMPVIYLDLKPSNIMISSHGRVCLVDFGISQYAGTVMKSYGTKGFCAPEQLKKGQKAGVGADIYSLGKVLEFGMVSVSDGSMKSVIEKCTGKNPEDRYRSIREVRKNLKEIRRKRRRKTLAFVLLFFMMIKEGTGLYKKQDGQKNIRPVILKRSGDVSLDGVKEMINFVHKHPSKHGENDVIFQKLGEIYLFGTPEIACDTELAKQYLQKIKHKNKVTKRYQRLAGETTKWKQRWEDLEVCKKKANTVCQKYFLANEFIKNGNRLRSYGNPWKEASVLLKGLEDMSEENKQPEDWKQDLRKMWMSIAKGYALQGDEVQMNLVLDHYFQGREAEKECFYAYQLLLKKYEGSDEKTQDIYEKFLQKYPHVSQAYIEYGIYLCSRNQWKKALDIYRLGKRMSWMKGREAELLKEKLGL